MAARFLASGECTNVIAKAVDVVQCTSSQKSINLGEVTKGRSGQSVLAVKCPGDLARIERDGHFVLHGPEEGLGQVEVRAALGIEGAKEPNLVLNDRTADVATDVRFRES